MSQRISAAGLIALAAALLVPYRAPGADETGAPDLRVLSFTPSTIDTSAGAAETTLSFTVLSDAAGPVSFEAAFMDPSGVFRQSASGQLPGPSGSYLAKIAFPRFSTPGTWTLSHLFLSDAAGRSRDLDTAALAARGFPTRLEVRSTLDRVSPKLAYLEFVPARIDTSFGAEQVRVNYTATDDLSGVNYIEVSFASPTGAEQRLGSVKLDPSGSVSNFMLVTFPGRSAAGRWTLKTVFLSDAANNTTVLSTEEIARLGFPTSLDVISAEDTDPPRLESLRFSPDLIDTTEGPATVQVGFRATDKLSGVRSLEVVFESPSGVSRQRGSAEFPSLNGVSDSVKVTFPKLSEPGRWALMSAFVADAAGNTLALDASGLAGMGVPTALNVRSAPDTVPPSLTALQIAPGMIDTRRGPAEVQVGIKATDNGSGVKSVDVVFVSPSGSMKMRGGAEFLPSGEVTTSLKVIFPPNSEPGLWKMDSVVLTDAATNTLVLGANALASRAGKLQVR